VTDTLPPPAVTGRPGQAYEASRIRLATSKDIGNLVALWQLAYPESITGPAEMAGWLEHGGVLTMEARDRTLLAALRWRHEDSGWRVDRVATRPEERGQGYGRWLTTKVEALAIKHSISHLRLTLPDEQDDEQLVYYQRMGYALAHDDAEGRTLRKVVGGEWQVKASPHGPAGA
jgi:GNAT superfamily N-acetyltransferase